MSALLISVVGASGVGKTSLVRALAATGRFATGLETHAERPYQARFAADHRFALPNQIDFLLFRAEQEAELRQADRPALLDGGLDLDYHGFTRLFHERGYLDDEEFALCRRLYERIRALQPPPDLFIHLTAPPEVIAARLASRDRVNVATAQDADRLGALVADWLATLPPGRVLPVDASPHDPAWSRALPGLLERLGAAEPRRSTS